MRRRNPLKQASWSLLLAAALLLVACAELRDPVRRATAPDTSDRAAAEVKLPREDVVDITLYFRAGVGAQAHLVPVTRAVRVGGNLPLRSLELLLAGPAAGDPPGLSAPLPTTTKVRGFHVEKGRAVVDLSPHVITDAHTVGASAANELLALAALANTLTEFPQIEAVRVLVEGGTSGVVDGVDVSKFWGGWGLPERLVRDDSLIGTRTDGNRVLDVDRFRSDHHEIGSSAAGAVQVRNIRLRDRTGYVRVVLELADGADPDVAATVPRCSAWREDGSIVLDLLDVAEYTADVTVGQRQPIADGTVESFVVERGQETGNLRIRLAVPAERAFFLHSLSDPTRVVLDIRKQTTPTS